MVAYGFQPMFVSAIEARTKRQTIRLPRKRHARPGEPVQLYQGMRTKACRKIVPDPVCVGIDEVRIDLRDIAAPQRDLLKEIALGRSILQVNGIPLSGSAANTYAAGDGFPAVLASGITSMGHMAVWWVRQHGTILFEGVAILWEHPS